nr:asparagine synthase (glutamine-hydrolyzing) [Dechloromonas sp. A34]
MCGILGSVGPTLPSLEQFGKMLDTLAHRGPDGRGIRILAGGAALFGHRRLAIIDLSANGTQPIGNEDGSVWLVFNGEIYNYKALRNELKTRGHRFFSLSDSEVVVHAYEEWGAGCVARLQGIFAFAIWDEQRSSLFLARDPMGVKPLYYANYAGRLTFASQPKAILADPAFKREIAPHGLRDFFALGYIPHSRSAFSGISKLPAGHVATFRNGHLDKHCYWHLPAQSDLADPEDALLRLEVEIENAVRDQLVSDVPIGCFLSGGIDSSLLVALAKRSTPSLRTFTIGFDEPICDEREHAHIIAQHFATEHHEAIVSRSGIEDRLITMQEYFDEPFDPNGPLPFFEVARLARANNTLVALGGDGADELFAGYLRYDDFDRPAWIPSGPPARLWHWMRQLQLVGPRRMRSDDADRYFRYEGCLDAKNIATLFDPSFFRHVHDTETDILKHYLRSDLPAVTAAQIIDMHVYLVDHVLCKVDRASMAHGVEARVPFLADDLVRLAFRLPLGMHYYKGERKALLKRLAKKILPEQVVTTRKKGFSSPMHSWFGHHIEPWMRSLFRESVLVDLGILKPDWRVHLDNLLQRDFPVGWRTRWLLITAELWAKRWIADTDLSSFRTGTSSKSLP